MELVLRNKKQTMSGNNTHSGSNTFSGANTFSRAVAFTGVQTSSEKLLNTKNAGAKADVATLAVQEAGDGVRHITTLTLTNFIVGALAGAGAALAVGNKIYTFPAGFHLEEVSYIDLSLKAAGTAVNTDTGLGSVIGTGAVATLDGTATFEDRHTGQTIATAAAGGSAVKSLKNTTAGVQTGIALNVSNSIKDVFLNAAGTWNANNTGNLTATGTVVLVWTTLVTN
jgi:hypothetical protein